MSDVFDDEADAEPTISIGDYLKTVEEEELVSGFSFISTTSPSIDVHGIKKRGFRFLWIWNSGQELLLNILRP